MLSQPGSKLKQSYILISAAMLCGASVNVLAQSAAEQSTAERGSETRAIEVIQVSATKRVTTIRETPLAVTAFDQNALDDNHVMQLDDLQGAVPSLHIAQNGTQNTPMVYLRGIGSSDQTESGDPAVAFHVDGVYSARSQGASALMFDLEGAEILRGPQGTLFGRNATGGVVNLHTAKPKLDYFEANAEFTLGNFNRRASRAMVNLPLTDTLAIRVAAAVDKSDGVVDMAPGSAMGRKYGSTDLAAARFSALWQPNDNFDWFFSYENFTDQGTGHIPTVSGGSDREAYIQEPGFNDFVIDSLRTRLNYNFDSGITLSYIGGYTDSSRESVWDRSWSPDKYEWGGCVECTHEATQHELQLKNEDSARLQWMVGYFYFKENNATIFDIVHPDVDYEGGSTPNPNLWSTYRQPDRGLKSNSIYAQSTYKITDAFRVSLGLRYTEDERWDVGGRNIMCPDVKRTENLPLNSDYVGLLDPDNLLNGLAPNKFLVQPGQCWVDTYNDTSPSWDKTTGMARLEWDFSPTVMLYSSYATGFKSGTIQDGGRYTGTGPFTQADLDAIIAGNNNEAAGTNAYVAPEENTSIELGLKGAFLDNTLQLFAALFTTEYTDLQVTSNITTATGADLLRKTNAGKATINGLELEAKWLVGPNGELNGTMAYLDAKYDEFLTTDSSYGADGIAFNPSAGNPNLPNLLDFSGNSLVQAPEFSMSLSYEHFFELSNGATVRPRVRGSYSSEVWFDPANRGDRPEGFRNLPYAADIDRQDAYTKLDASLVYQPSAGNWSLEAFVNNLTDKAIKSDQGRWNSNPVPNYMWQSPRTFGVRVKVSFD
ncbi:TonB-dependent receptor [Rheinheimera sp. YQF-2]|uniref:TonB-dependent receptor n=1 Tax=Rheinheimera lutimaris TaxID=2740584 RepID=A0A7Y5EJZ2_9GAMM|nr:TonB-dependent receptor [Rheinheimera lutimaris]NRQ43846.1 TonB-dependent receptor [Rheinheimera lutimaris]